MPLLPLNTPRPTLWPSIALLLFLTHCGDSSTPTRPDESAEPPALTEYWITRAPMLTPRQEIYPCVLAGKIYIIGGFDVERRMTQVAEVFDPATLRRHAPGAGV
jgi:hypothetical protein